MRISSNGVFVSWNLWASAFHEAPDAEKGANRPGGRSSDFHVGRGEHREVLLQYLTAVRTRVSVEEVVQLNATVRTFSGKHNIGGLEGA